jgi:hypothetical protein
LNSLLGGVLINFQQKFSLYSEGIELAYVKLYVYTQNKNPYDLVLQRKAAKECFYLHNAEGVFMPGKLKKQIFAVFVLVE